MKHCPRIKLLENRHQGRAVIVANGPSLNSMDLGFLKNEIVIGLNKIYLGFKKYHFYPKYYVAVNRKVIEQSLNDIRSLNCVKFLSRQGATEQLPEDALTYHLNTGNPPERFCRDISIGIEEGGTVTYAALQIAYFLGFREIVIIGMDHSYSFQGEPHQSTRMGNVDPNHFSEKYFAGMEWDNPDLAMSEQSYRIAKQVYEEDGRVIVDATVDGGCDVFEKQDYRAVFGLT